MVRLSARIKLKIFPTAPFQWNNLLTAPPQKNSKECIRYYNIFMIHVYIWCKRRHKCKYCWEKYTHCNCSFHSFQKNSSTKTPRKTMPLISNKYTAMPGSDFFSARNPKYTEGDTTLPPYKHFRLNFREHNCHDCQNQIVKFSIRKKGKSHKNQKTCNYSSSIPK